MYSKQMVTGMTVLERAKDIIYNKPELLTVFIGDSHTWGQGADGADSALAPPPVLGGEIRRLPETIPCFVSLYGSYMKRLRQTKKTFTLNFGFGCASSSKYLDVYWEQAVLRFTPDLLVIEFAINDWLVDPVSPDVVTVEQFTNNLNTMIDQALDMESIPLLLSVSPIRGVQTSAGHHYPDYIEATRAVALKRKEETLFADANRLMTQFLEEGDYAAKEKELFSDDWHVSQLGHELYFQAIRKALEI
jgi:lysophospholipase L1-like esterase